MNSVSLSARSNESLKSKILRRVREEEKQLSSPEAEKDRISARERSRRFPITRLSSFASSQRSRSLRLNSKSQLKESEESNSKRPKSLNMKKNRSKSRVGRESQKSLVVIGVKELVSSCKKKNKQSSNLLDSSGDSKEAKQKLGPIKRRLRSSTSLVSSPMAKVCRKNTYTREMTSPRSLSPGSANMKNPWVVSESPRGLVIVEVKHSKKMSACDSTEAFCSCTDETSCCSADSTKAGRQKRSKVHLTQRMDDCCLKSEDLSKKGQAKSNSTRRKVSKQKKIGSDDDPRAKRPTRQRSNTKNGEKKPMQKLERTDDHPNYFLQDSKNSGITSKVISHTSKGNFKKEDGSIVRQFINQRIDETLTTQNDPKNDTSSIKPHADVVMSADDSLAKHQLTENDTETQPQSDMESTTVTKIAAAEAAKAVGGISLMPLLKSKNPDFVSTVSSPCTLTMTVMKASSDQIVSSTTMSSESNPIVRKTKMSDEPKTSQTASGTSAPSVASDPKEVVQCKYVASTSTVPTPSMIKAGNVATAGQPIFLSSDAFQFQPVSYPGYSLLDISSAVPVTQSSKPKRKRSSGKKKSLEKKTQSPGSGMDSPSLTVVSISTISSPVSESSTDHPDTDPTRPDVKDPSLDEKGEKIKRPMNAFMIWSRQQRAILARQTPKMTNAEISVKLGIMWNDLDYNIKQEYFDEAIQLKLQHRKDHPDWVYQPRPHKRPSRRKHLPVPMFRGENQQMPYNQMVLIMADGQEVLCPAIPMQTGQRHGSMMTMQGPAKNRKGAKAKTKSKERVPKAVTITTDSNVTPKPTVEVVGTKKNTTETKKQTKSKMPVVACSKQDATCQANPQESSHITTSQTTDSPGVVTSGSQLDAKTIQNCNQNNNQPKAQLLLVLPDGRHVLCPQASNSSSDDAKVESKLIGLPSGHSMVSEEKMLIRVKSEKGGEKKTIIPLKSQPGLANAPDLGPVMRAPKGRANSISKAALPPVIPGGQVNLGDDKEHQQTTKEENMVTSTRMSVPNMQSETTGSDHTEFMGTSIYAQRAPCDTDDMMVISKPEAVPVPVAISAVGKVELSNEGDNQSVARLPNQMRLQLSNLNQQSPSIEMNSPQMQPTNFQMPTQHIGNSSWEMGHSSRLLPDVKLAQVGFQQSVNNQIPMQHVNGTLIESRSHTDGTSVPFNLQGSVNQVPIQQLANSLKVTGDSSRPHSNFTLIPLDLQEPVVGQQPICKDTGVQTLQDWSSSSSNVPATQTLLSQFPSSALKTRPIDMVWHPDTRILQPANMSNKGTSTSSLSHPFYFTPIQQDQGGQDASTVPSVCPQSVPSTLQSCTVPLATGTLTDSDPTSVAISASQFSDTPVLCEINEPDCLLESLAMSGVEISEDEAEETENLFQRVMSMVSNN